MKRIILILLIFMTPIIADSICLSHNATPIFSLEEYHSSGHCFCLGQRLYKGPYYEIYNDLDDTHYAKPSDLIRVIGTTCKFRIKV